METCSATGRHCDWHGFGLVSYDFRVNFKVLPLFAKSHETLSALAAEALREHRYGKTEQLDPYQL